MSGLLRQLPTRVDSTPDSSPVTKHRRRAARLDPPEPVRDRVVALYAALLALTAAGAILLVPSQLIANKLGHTVGLINLVTLAWLASSLATIAGALGAGLENGEAIREAAYKYQPDDELPERPR